jgi:hypothetical protein
MHFAGGFSSGKRLKFEGSSFMLQLQHPVAHSEYLHASIIVIRAFYPPSDTPRCKEHLLRSTLLPANIENGGREVLSVRSSVQLVDIMRMHGTWSFCKASDVGI